ncbi:hypothetical protein JOL79_11245 [Microbispora sp. RL4-1S]|uniref:Uncharacterized protein n=1 Tax=Microbispora oryzae TaxID=2806554 RepID=A0A940WK66_9ACTN|nr:hypothetical protein [Microbispora oryzae]MBP2704388.1 hypothetical protein [Microbispora oryzae]
MEPISSLSRININSFITGATGTEAVDIAFTTPNIEPDTEDWHAAAWGTPTPTGCVARILIGPGDGTVTLTDGTYDMWVRVTGPVQAPVFRTGQIAIT